MDTSSPKRFFILVWCIGIILLYTAARFIYAEDFLSHASGLAASPVILLFLFSYTKEWLTQIYGSSPDATGTSARLAIKALSKAIIFLAICELIIIGKLLLVVFYPAPISKTENQAPADTSTEPIDLTANWTTYTNKPYGFELRYPPDLESSRSTGNETFEYCNGTTTEQGCDGILYRLAITVLNERFDTSRFDTYFDTPVRRYEVHRREFYTGMQNMYDYNGFAAYTMIGNITIGIHFSGNGFIENSDSLTPAELQKIIAILSTLREI